MDEIINTIGFTSRIDRVKNVKAQIMNNTIVLEDSLPYSGYPKTFIPDSEKRSKPKSIFFITKHQIPYTILKEISFSIQQEFKHFFMYGSGNIKIQEDIYNCIRIGDLESYELIKPLQELYRAKGNIFINNTKFINSEAQILIYKQLLIQKINNNIYQDALFMDRYYITVPKNIMIINEHGLEFFIKLTNEAKKLIPEIDFNAGLSNLYIDGKIESAGRFFSSNPQKPLSIYDLKLILEAYLETYSKNTAFYTSVDFSSL
jgi:hypothetical protein